MNLYFLVEGKRTEPILYPKWITYTFPHLTLVRKIEEVISDSMFLFAAHGYPKILQLLGQALTDISNHYVKNHIIIDHFFICLDADEEGYNKQAFSTGPNRARNAENSSRHSGLSKNSYYYTGLLYRNLVVGSY